MVFPKVAPLLALISSVAALFLLGLAPLGWRAGWWPYRFGLAWLMPASAVFAAIAVGVSLLALVLTWSELDLRALTMIYVALVLGGAIIAIPLQYLFRGVPAIHDITTDTDNPPAFSAVLPSRAAERAGSVDYRDARVPQLQKKAYPDVVPLMTALPVAQAFGAALEVAQSMPGWI